MNTHPTRYNMQRLRKELKGFTQEQLDDTYWWTFLSPAWDSWSLPDLQRLFDTVKEV